MGDSETYPATDDERWRAVLARDARCDGAFVYAVRSTRVFCHRRVRAAVPGALR